MSGSTSKIRSRPRTQPRRLDRTPASAPDLALGLLRSLRERWIGFAVQTARCRTRATEKAIHDLRVATRRMIVMLDILGSVRRRSDFAATRRSLKRHLRAFSALRDLQVQMIAVRRLTPRFPFLGMLRTVLAVRRKQFRSQARREILAIRLQAMEQELATVETRLEALLADPTMRDAVRQIVLGALGKTFARAATLRTGALSGKPARIHRFRIAFKKFRYTVEVLQQLLPAVDPKLLKAMNAYQTRMGDIQDIEVFIGTTTAFTQRHIRTHPVQSLRLKVYLMNRRREMILQFLASADELDGFWHSLFATPPPGA